MNRRIHLSAMFVALLLAAAPALGQKFTPPASPRVAFNFNPGWGLLENDAFHVLRAYMSPWTPLSVEALPLMRPRAAEGGKGEGEGRTAETALEFAERVRRAMSWGTKWLLNRVRQA